MSVRSALAQHTRPVRRRLTPRQFKETYLREFLASRSQPTYVEIGVQTGESFRLVAAARKLGIDPVRQPTMSRLGSGESFFEKTSDEFFAQDAVAALPPGSVDLALVDGLHEYRQTLNDVLNLEPFMRSDGLIVIDDCNPLSRERALDQFQPGTWNGDVWKVIAFLRGERTDLRCVTVNADQGIGLLTGFHGTVTPPDPATVRRYKDLDYDTLDRDRTQILGLQSPAPLSSLT